VTAPVSQIVDIHDVSKRYGRIEAVRGVSLSLAPGEGVALVGHNGAGKTTLMKLVLGLVTPSSGTLSVLGADPASGHGAQARRRLGFLPENVAFHGAMTGRELIGFYARLKGVPAREAHPLLARVGLEDAARRRVATYSKGMRQRLGLAQALIGAPRLLLLDEPTSGLDPDSRRDFYDLVERLRGDGVGVLISTHALAEVETRVDRVAVMYRGRLVACGSLAELRHAAALPLRVRVRVSPCSSGAVLGRVADYAVCEAREVTSMTLSVPVAAKMTLLRDLAALGELVQDIDIEAPGLDHLYRHLGALEGNR
jgi:Cu-processing system ATP-binding protein